MANIVMMRFVLPWRKGYNVTLQAIFYDYPDPVEAARIYNETQVPWGTRDYMFSGIALNKVQYIILENFCREHKYLMNGSRPKYDACIALLYCKAIPEGTKNLPEISKEQIQHADLRYKILEMIVLQLGEESKTAFFRKGAILGFYKLFAEIGDASEIRQFIVNGINNRFRPPTLDGRNVGINTIEICMMFTKTKMDKYILSSGKSAIVEFQEQDNELSFKVSNNQPPLSFSKIGEAMEVASKINTILGEQCFKIFSINFDF